MDTNEKPNSAHDEICQIERARLLSLVEADLVIARRLHADDFQLITPVGAVLSKAEYLEVIESGQLIYRAWEADEITVRLYGDAAMIRYKDIRFDVDGKVNRIIEGQCTIQICMSSAMGSGRQSGHRLQVGSRWSPICT